MGAGKMDPNILWLVAVPFAGWLAKDYAELRSIKDDVPHIRERVDALYDKLVDKALDKEK